MMTPVVYAPPVAAALRKRYIKIFKKEDALAADKAINPDMHGIRRNGTFKNLLKQGVLVEVTPDAFYLDIERDTAVRSRRRKTGIIVLAAMIIILSLITIFIFF